jgi:hypothetical protein
MESQPLTIPSHSYEPTNDKNIFRFVDRDGDWTHYWIKNKKKFVPAVNHIIRTGFPKGERFYAYLMNTSPDQAARRLATAGEEGARTHDAIRHLIDGKRVMVGSTYFNELTKSYEPLSAEEWRNLRAFANWSNRYKPEELVHEYTVWSEHYQYAGTLDFIGTILIPKDEKSFPEDLRGKTNPGFA